MFEECVVKGLDRVFQSAVPIPFDMEKDKYILFSDQHMGDGTLGSDDFLPNEGVYHHALNHYFNSDFTLISIGDVEELWECDFNKVGNRYSQTYGLENKFLGAGRLYRIWGNHDGFWRRLSNVKDFLSRRLSGVAIHEAVRIGEQIFVTHGHQGELFSDRLWRFSRFIVRYIWKPFQILTCRPSNSPAENHKVRDTKEQIYYKWAKKKKLLFIAGHTHRGMFGSLSKIDRLRMKIEEKIEQVAKLQVSSPQYHQLMSEVLDLRNKLEESLQENRKGEREKRFESTGPLTPCYFNDGCCCYPDGITGIEIDQGVIRLVKWEKKNSGITKKVFEEDNLKKILLRIELFAQM